MSNDKLAEALRELFVKWLESRSPFRTTVEVEAAWEGWKANTAIAAMLAAEITEPVAWTRQDVISDGGGCPIGMDEPRIAWGAECPDYEGGWAPLYSRPQPAQDASKYQELLMAVEKKFPGESRHETALRYIRQAELRSCEPKCDSSMAKESGR